MCTKPMLCVSHPFISLKTFGDAAVLLKAVFDNQTDFVRDAMKERNPGIKSLNHLLGRGPVMTAVYDDKKHVFGADLINCRLQLMPNVPTCIGRVKVRVNVRVRVIYIYILTYIAFFVPPASMCSLQS